jgi:GTP cyclohydrolase I
MTTDKAAAADAVRALLAAIGEDTEREGLHGTPERVAKAWLEMLAGLHLQPGDVLRTSTGGDGFADVGGFDQMVVLADIPFHSVCEHHMLPFSGFADVGYLPGDSGLVVGVSKLARLVDLYARRLQVQERMTQQVAQALHGHLQARGVGVRVRAVHHCMSCRGVRKAGTMATEVLLGAFRDHAVRAEFWQLCNPLPRGA